MIPPKTKIRYETMRATAYCCDTASDVWILTLLAKTRSVKRDSRPSATMKIVIWLKKSSVIEVWPTENSGA